MLFAGTSHSVGVTQLVYEAAQDRHTPMFSIDPSAPPLPGVQGITAGSEIALVELCARLGVEVT